MSRNTPFALLLFYLPHAVKLQNAVSTHTHTQTHTKKVTAA
jgi:hypothetical protein